MFIWFKKAFGFFCVYANTLSCLLSVAQLFRNVFLEPISLCSLLEIWTAIFRFNLMLTSQLI